MLVFFRVIKFAWQDMWRNMSLSIMTLLILILMLLSVNTLFVIRVLTNTATTMVKQQIDVSIFFNSTSTPSQISSVVHYVNSFQEVATSTFMDKGQVLAKFRQHYKNNKDIISSLDQLGTNPLGATLIVQTKDPADYQKIITALNAPEYKNIVEAKTFGDTEQAIKKIDSITTQVEHFSFALTIFFGIIAFLIIFNAIRIAIYTQRVEISIKKLVGATNWFVRGPYLVESFIFSVFSVAIAYGLVLVISHFLDIYITATFGQSAFLTSYFQSNILWLVGIQFLVVLVLTMFSSLLAIRRHLKV